MPLSWNEIKHRAIAFSKEWQDETREEAEAKSFWDAFFHVFGVPRRTVASFEESVKKLSGEYGTDATGRAGHELNQFLVRLLFCLFAEDNGNLRSLPCQNN